SENRSVANWCSEPLAFSTVNVTSPSLPYGLRSSRAGTGTGAGRGLPPQAVADQSIRRAMVRETVAFTGRLRTWGVREEVIQCPRPRPLLTRSRPGRTSIGVIFNSPYPAVALPVVALHEFVLRRAAA